MLKFKRSDNGFLFRKIRNVFFKIEKLRTMLISNVFKQYLSPNKRERILEFCLFVILLRWNYHFDSHARKSILCELQYVGFKKWPRKYVQLAVKMCLLYLEAIFEIKTYFVLYSLCEKQSILLLIDKFVYCNPINISLLLKYKIYVKIIVPF